MSPHDHEASLFAKSPIATAVTVGLLSLAPHLFLSREASLGFSAVLLGVIAGVYFGFAVMRGSSRDQLVELGVASGFGLAALLGLLVDPWFLPSAYVAHGLWDAAHHSRANLRLVAIPQWYPSWCAVIDFLIAAGLIAIWRATGLL